MTLFTKLSVSLQLLLAGSSLLGSSLISVTGVDAATVTYNWNITYVNVNPDGLKTRRAIGVNNKWPVEPINVRYNDTLVINVVNNIDFGTSLHCHGLFQNGTVQYDGPSMVTQCPIPPGETFQYVIPIKQWGTYWIHGHNRGQYVDGLRAPLIVQGPNEPNNAPQKYDKEYTITLTDWYHDEHHPLLQQFMSPFNPTGAEPVPVKSALMNESKNPIFQFEAGKVYRIRVISMAAFAMFKFYIDGHDMQIIEVDGIDTEPFTAPSIMVAAAQRYSLLVKARASNNGTDVNYQIHGDMDEDMFDQVPDGLDSTVTGLVTYAADGKAAAETFAAESTPDMAAEDTALLTVNFLVLDDGVNYGTFNNIPYIKPRVPTLFTALTVYGKNAMPHVLDHNEVVELVVDNTDAGAHPFHLHGHVFQIVDLNGDHPYDANNVSAPEFPMRRDVVVIPGGGYAVLRFKADNPGVWLFHCHIEWHLEAGLVITLIEAPNKLTNITMEPTFQRHCAAQNIPSSGNALGKVGLDLQGYPRGPGMGGLIGAAASAVIGIATVVWFAKPEEEEEEKRGEVAAAAAAAAAAPVSADVSAETTVVEEEGGAVKPVRS
ncbi:multicopper oxidase-domain-containing protein [Chytridium lagenaria]|nr:multicopper oxidase-domain-containing protein [Chytridium lagenaria]